MEASPASAGPTRRRRSEADGTATTTSESAPLLSRQLVDIPGSYGLPILGAIADRLDYYWFQGPAKFFRSRMEKYGGSTVFRTNMPPGPFISTDSRVVALLDAETFQVLFDCNKVEKGNVFTGTFVPYPALTGGYRVLSYLDPSEPSHTKLKLFVLSLLRSRHGNFVPEFSCAVRELFDELESVLASGRKAGFNAPCERASFKFLCRAFLGRDPANGGIGNDGPALIQKWILVQLAPDLSLGLPKPLEELLLRTFRLPPCLVKNDYKRLVDFFRAAGGPALDEAERLGISRDEALHNLIFLICFNSWGGLKVLLPCIIKWIAGAGPEIHRELAREVRSSGAATSVGLNPAVLERLPLLNSAIYEVLRIEPPLPLQYGRAKRDLVLESHRARYKVRAGEMLCGYQPLATRDPLVFENSDSYVANRFVGEEGERLLKYVVWSNGQETAEPTERNKQCPGKDLVMLVARIMVAELFLRYDSLEVEATDEYMGDSVTITSLRPASPSVAVR
ncbi:allene oxide synthase, chloroplastic-like [Nymphaea colorata]|uniref:Allene oxide synthase n=1 Tax=Nymphaea colorata TaxID=210225 RepID=A0A5K1BNR6_9MAGN|nr:allene oxide synthase, chloroplastic-like [Nymphaea colorata]